jgi:hypothetical protein
MKDPIRHDWYEDDMRPAPFGLWVEWDAYAALKAENDLLHSSKCVYFIHGEGRWANIIEENARLKSEVERLKGEAPVGEAKRYGMSWGKDEEGYIYISPHESPKGMWVKWEDYQSLKNPRNNS